MHDEGDKDLREKVEQFKSGKIDLLLFTTCSLLVDAERLLYLAESKGQFLQTLTRVNRPYNNFRYGYVIDFADIEKEFEKTNKNYLNELESELGDEITNYSNLFKSDEEINKEIEEIEEVLFQFDVSNAEIFSEQISKINDRSEVLKIAKVLNNVKSLYNNIRLSGKNMLRKLDFQGYHFL